MEGRGQVDMAKWTKHFITIKDITLYTFSLNNILDLVVCKKPGMVPHAVIPATWEGEAGRLKA